METSSNTAPVLPVTREVFPGNILCNQLLQKCEEKKRDGRGILHEIASQCFTAFSAHVVPVFNVWPIFLERSLLTFQICRNSSQFTAPWQRRLKTNKMHKDLSFPMG